MSTAGGRSSREVTEAKMSDQWWSKSNILSIIIGVFSIAVPLLNEYLGLGGVGVLVLGGLLLGIIIFLRQSKIFPYLACLILFAAGVSIGLSLNNGGISIFRDTDNGVKIPASDWTLKSQIIDNSEDKTKKRFTATVSIKSTQSENTFGSPLEKISYVLPSSGIIDEIGEAPLQGIKSTIYVVPLNSSYENELIYCNYTMKYDGRSYTSSTYFVPLNSPSTLVWDFTSQPDIDFDGLPEEIKTQFDTAKEFIFQDNNGFVSFSRRFPETWQYQVMENKNAVDYNPEKIQQIALECGVSATQGYVGGNPGDVFNFQGTFTFSDVVIYPFLGKPVK